MDLRNDLCSKLYRSASHSLYTHLNINLDCAASGLTRLIVISSGVELLRPTSLVFSKSASSVNHVVDMPTVQVACKI